MAKAKGSPKTGGRLKGTPNKSTAEIKAYAQEFGKDAISVISLIMYHSIDPRLRVTAAKEILDRGYGRPAQGVELSGPEGGPIETVSLSDKELARLTAYLTLEAVNDKVA